jgi:hypothetical protein
MACLELGPPDLPQVPSPFSFSPPSLDAIQAEATLCCKLGLIKIPGFAPFPSSLITPAFAAGINAMMAAAKAYFTLVPLSCPLE